MTYPYIVSKSNCIHEHLSCRMSPDLYMRCPSSSSSTDGTRELCNRKRANARMIVVELWFRQGMDGHGWPWSVDSQDMVSKGTARVDRHQRVVPQMCQSVAAWQWTDGCGPISRQRKGQMDCQINNQSHKRQMYQNISTDESIWWDAGMYYMGFKFH